MKNVQEESIANGLPHITPVANQKFDVLVLTREVPFRVRSRRLGERNPGPSPGRQTIPCAMWVFGWLRTQVGRQHGQSRLGKGTSVPDQWLQPLGSLSSTIVWIQIGEFGCWRHWRFFLQELLPLSPRPARF